MIQLNLIEYLDPKNDEWLIWGNARNGAVCDECCIVKKYAIPHNASGTPFYRRKKYSRGKINKLCYFCYWKKGEKYKKEGEDIR